MSENPLLNILSALGINVTIVGFDADDESTGIGSLFNPKAKTLDEKALREFAASLNQSPPAPEQPQLTAEQLRDMGEVIKKNNLRILRQKPLTILYKDTGDTVLLSTSICHPTDKWDVQRGIFEATMHFDSGNFIMLPIGFFNKLIDGMK